MPVKPGLRHQHANLEISHPIHLTTAATGSTEAAFFAFSS
jgi:hypothetical protein